VLTHPAAGHQAGEQRPVQTAWVPEIHILRRGGLLELGAFQPGRVLSRLAFGGLAVDQQAEALLE